MFKKLLIALGLVNLIALDVFIAYYFLVSQKATPVSSTADNIANLKDTIQQNENPVDICGDDCKSYIDQKVVEDIAKAAANVTPTPSTAPVKAIVPVTKKSVSYLPISGSGDTTNTDWVDIAGTDFYMSKSDYPGLIGFYFEANISLLNGNGAAYFRIYDATHSVAVVGSEISTSSQVVSFVSSGQVYFWEGYNHYVVQGKSLTADTAKFESGRLKIITEN
jgi:hypothetical protein